MMMTSSVTALPATNGATDFVGNSAQSLVKAADHVHV